jgi:hypothetical protein
MEGMLTYAFPEDEASDSGMQRFGTVAEICARTPDHSICAIANRGGGGGGNGGNHGGGHDGAAASNRSGGADRDAWSHPLDEPDNRGGNLSWYPFSWRGEG